VACRVRYDSYAELPEQMPVEWYDHPRMVTQFIEKCYPHSKKKASVEIDINDVEA